MRFLLAVAVLFALAGCVTPNLAPAGTAPGLPEAVSRAGVFHVAPDAPLQAVAAPMPLAVGAQFSLGVAAAEPTIGATKDGGVFMTGVRKGTLGGSQPTLIATFDNGQTMKDVGARLPTGDNPALESFDPMVMVDYETGRVFQDDIWPLGCGTLSFSDDQGKTWTTNPASCGNPQVNDHQTIGVSKPNRLVTVGYPNLVWRCVNNVAYTGCAPSLNGGLSFLPQIPFGGPADGCSASTGHLRSDSKGRLFVPLAGCDEGTGYYVTEDDGLTWQKVIVDTKHPPEWDLEMAVDSADNLYGVWTSEGLVWFSSSSDGGKTWSPARNVVAPGVTATMFASIAAGEPGRVAFAYVGSTIEGGYAGKPAGFGGLLGDIMGEPDPPEWAEATWNGYIGIMTDALNPDAPIQTVTANDPADPLARGMCGRTRCHGMNDFLGITIDGAGRPWAAFVDVCTAKCVEDPSVHWDKALGFMGTVLTGPALRGADVALPEIAPPPTSGPGAATGPG